MYIWEWKSISVKCVTVGSWNMVFKQRWHLTLRSYGILDLVSQVSKCNKYVKVMILNKTKSSATAEIARES